MTFKNRYTTLSLEAADPVAEKDKIVVSEESYLIAGLLEVVAWRLSRNG